MSETSSARSSHLHPLSSSSSMSSSDSAPQSEPTSDEQPDLGAFNAILREFNHLQPIPRLPVYRRPPTSSTASTFQADQSIAGDEMRSRSFRSRNSRLSSRSGISGLSSFTRPTSSSERPEGSTVWAHAAIAPYLMSQTPVSEEYDSYEESQQGSGVGAGSDLDGLSLHSPASTEGGRTVEIVSDHDYPSFDTGSHDPQQSSPHPSLIDSEVAVPVSLHDGQRLDSREPDRLEGDFAFVFNMIPVANDAEDDSSMTSRDYFHSYQPSRNLLVPQSYTQSISPGDSAFESMQLRSQAPQATTTIPSSSSSGSHPVTSSTSTATEIPSSVPIFVAHSFRSSNNPSASDTSASSSTIPPSYPGGLQIVSQRDDSGSLYTATMRSATSSNLSLLSYQIPETPINIVEESDHEPLVSTTQSTAIISSANNNPAIVTRTSFVSEPSSTTVSLKSQRSLLSTSSSSSLSNSTPTYPIHQFLGRTSLQSGFPTVDDNSVSNLSHADEASTRSLITSDSPSSVPDDENGLRARPPSLATASVEGDRNSSVDVLDKDNTGDDVGTPDHPPSETIPYNPPRQGGYRFTPVQDDDDDDFERHATQALEQRGAHSSHDARPQVLGISGLFPPSMGGTQSPVRRNTDYDNLFNSYRGYPHTRTPGSHSHIHTPRGIPQSTQQTTYPPQIQQESSDSQISEPLRLNETLYDATRIPPITTASDPMSQAHHNNNLVQPYHPPLMLTRGHNHGMGYPHSLLGLHALPTTLISPQPYELPHVHGVDAQPVEEGFASNSSQFYSFEPNPFEHEAPAAIKNEEDEDGSEPSLGFLDEALRFIAEERVRLATREGNMVASASNQDNDAEDVEETLGDGKSSSANNETPRRKRRRNRTGTKAKVEVQADAAIVVVVPPVPEETLSPLPPPDHTPKIRKKPKSAALSVASIASSSSVSGASDSINSTDKAKKKEKEFLVAAPVTILKRPDEPHASLILDSPDNSDDDGTRTPTNAKPDRTTELTVADPLGPINLFGAKGNRVGRREREAEKMKRDLLRQGSVDEVEDIPIGVIAPEAEFGRQYADDNGQDDDDNGASPNEEEREESALPHDLRDLELLQPPPPKKKRERRRKKKDPSSIHSTKGGAYKSVPGSPKAMGMELGQDEAGEQHFSADEGETRQSTIPGDSIQAPPPANPGSPEKKKRVRTRRKNQSEATSLISIGGEAEQSGGVGRLARDFDILDLDRNEIQRIVPITSGGPGASLLSLSKPASAPVAPLNPNGKRARLIVLGKRLRQLFPAQRTELDRIIARFENQGNINTQSATNGSSKVVRSVAFEESSASPIAIPGAKSKRPRRRKHLRVGSEGAITDLFEGPDSDAAEGTESNEVTENKEDEELDPRGRVPRKNDPLIHVFIDHSNILIGLLEHLKRNPPPLPATTYDNRSPPPTGNFATSAFAAVKSTTARPLPIPSHTSHSSIEDGSPIPLPSFATTSRSLPTRSVLSNNVDNEEKKARVADQEFANSDAYGFGEGNDEEADDSNGTFRFRRPQERKTQRHLWHAALALILERGRPITRRVVVTSSPLYQPMDSMKHLGYDVRVYMRVPDLGDGMDRERRAGKSSAPGKGSQGSFNAPSYATLPRNAYRSMGHARHASESESGSGSGGGNSFHPYQGITSGTSTARMKYREQGVDELLQLKLHQALAATDDVPEGSTIVLATGDGNVGQFSEDGFIGPVRTALKRGWRVELYAWEDGLSRTWRREFGDYTELGRTGLFQIIPMEQFANNLVEAVQG